MSPRRLGGEGDPEATTRLGPQGLRRGGVASWHPARPSESRPSRETRLTAPPRLQQDRTRRYGAVGRRGSPLRASVDGACSARRLRSVSQVRRSAALREALQHKYTSGPAAVPKPNPPPAMTDGDQPATMERILQEITAVSHRIEGMDASISSLTLETKSIRTDIAGFHSRVMGLESRVETLETHMSTIQDRYQDLSYLRSKVTDLEDRSRSDNIRLLGIPENEEGTDVQTFLSSTIPS
ncbi:hypothetical protein NDU88_005159 [Pleurodeles waltl]|uniref:Uncharacterized protein n=1 Tax=Pleurodeles waltl TaxID=8319 RepID=A0AAV7QK76_PLEWA|nr:hypothetical protein NDU88_005159 [Pleurodeles waltl]